MSDPHKNLTEAVDSFLWFSGYVEKQGKITEAVLYDEQGGECQIGTKNFDRLASALREYKHPDAYVRLKE